jgi:hypothetical protein
VHGRADFNRGGAQQQQQQQQQQQPESARFEAVDTLVDTSGAKVHSMA